MAGSRCLFPAMAALWIRLVHKKQEAPAVIITEDCLGCGRCVEDFECPALSMDEENGIARVDPDRCHGCGTCIAVCPAQAIVREKEL